MNEILNKGDIMRYNYPQITKHIEPYYETEADGTLKNWGWFGYKGLSIERAIKNQDLEGIQKAHDLGWINPNTPKNMQVFGSPSLLDWVKERNLTKAAEKLESLGY